MYDAWIRETSTIHNKPWEQNIIFPSMLFLKFQQNFLLQSQYIFSNFHFGLFSRGLYSSHEGILWCNIPQTLLNVNTRGPGHMWLRETWQPTGSGNSLLPDVSKPSPKSLLTYHQWQSVEGSYKGKDQDNNHQNMFQWHIYNSNHIFRVSVSHNSNSK